MKLEGSCHCQSVKFSLQSSHPYPFNNCYCSICRKTAGSGGYAVNISGDASTLEVLGKENLSIYRAKKTDPTTGEIIESLSQRHFCKVCGSHLWSWNSTWPELLHPQAGAIDSELPVPPEHRYIMLGSKASWVPMSLAVNDQSFDEYPNESITDWHERLGLTQ